jgi:hypothetical protein
MQISGKTETIARQRAKSAPGHKKEISSSQQAVDHRIGGMRAIGANLGRIAGPVLSKGGLGEAQLLAEWPSVMGEDLARDSWPVKLTFRKGERRNGTLRLKVVSARALEFQHREPQILQRLNSFFGYSAIGRIVLVQAPLPDDRQAAPPPRPLDPRQETELDRSLARVDNPGLRAALTRLGRAVIGNSTE